MIHLIHSDEYGNVEYSKVHATYPTQLFRGLDLTLHVGVWAKEGTDFTSGRVQLKWREAEGEGVAPTPGISLNGRRPAKSLATPFVIRV